MHIIATDTLVADIATELELTPIEAGLVYHDVLLDDVSDDDSDEFDFGHLNN